MLSRSMTWSRLFIRSTELREARLLLLLFTVGGRLWPTVEEGKAEALTLLPAVAAGFEELIPMLDSILENGEGLEEEAEEEDEEEEETLPAVTGLAGAGGLGLGGGLVFPKEARLPPAVLTDGGGVTRLSRLLSFLVASLTELFLEMFSALAPALLLSFSLDPDSWEEVVELRRKDEEPALTFDADDEDDEEDEVSLRALTAGLLGGREGFLLADLLLLLTGFKEAVPVEVVELLAAVAAASWKTRKYEMRRKRKNASSRAMATGSRF